MYLNFFCQQPVSGKCSGQWKGYRKVFWTQYKEESGATSEIIKKYFFETIK
jgi:hypothetical protein